jgi:hypothetical protein
MMTRAIGALRSVLIVIIACYCFSCNNRSDYDRKFNNIQELKGSYVLSLPFLDYLEQFSEFPLELVDLNQINGFNQIYEAYMEYYIDSLSKEMSYFKYSPVYNITDNKRYGYILYSAGVDGKHNNKIDKSDTIYGSEVFEKYRFYNSLKPYCNGITRDTISDYSIFKQLFGKKDYLINFVVCK